MTHYFSNHVTDVEYLVRVILLFFLSYVVLWGILEWTEDAVSKAVEKQKKRAKDKVLLWCSVILAFVLAGIIR